MSLSSWRQINHLQAEGRKQPNAESKLSRMTLAWKWGEGYYARSVSTCEAELARFMVARSRSF